MKTRHYASEGRFTLGHKESAADGPLETGTRDKPFPTKKFSPLTARQFAQDISGRFRVSEKKTDLASPAMSASEVAACFIGTFLGLVAAALLIAVLG
jgi:hypothetical protein